MHALLSRSCCSAWWLLACVYIVCAWDCRKQHNLKPLCCDVPLQPKAAYVDCLDSHAPLLNKEANPCFFECISNKTQLLAGNELQLDKLRDSLKSRLDSSDMQESQLAARIVDTFRQCTPVVETLLQRPDLQDLAGNASCSKRAFGYMYCALVNTYVECPAQFWQSTEVCNQAREYLDHCDSMRLLYRQQVARDQQRPLAATAAFHMMRRRTRQLYAVGHLWNFILNL